TRAATAKTRRNRHVLLAASTEGQRKPLHRCAEPRFPQRLAGLHVDRAEYTIHVADKRHAARCRQYRSHEWNVLADRPQFLERFHVIRRELTHVPVRAWGSIEPARSTARAAAAFFQVDLLRVHLLAAFGDRNDQLVGAGMVAHRMPVVAAFRRGATLDPLAHLLLHDVVAIVRL